MNESTQEVYLPQVSYESFANWYANLYSFVIDVHQIIYPTMSIAQVSTPSLDAAIQSQYYNIS